MFIKETGIRNRNRNIIHITYSGQIGDRKYWNYVNNIEVICPSEGSQVPRHLK